ncbi:MAG: hypothetical protein WBD09_06325 [Halobacteriota archaeon]
MHRSGGRGAYIRQAKESAEISGISYVMDADKEEVDRYWVVNWRMDRSDVACGTI